MSQYLISNSTNPQKTIIELWSSARLSRMSDVYLVWSDKSKNSTDSKSDLLIFKVQNQTLPN